MKDSFRKVMEKYRQFVDRQGFPIIITACVAVITATALFTRKTQAAYVSPTPPPVEHISAAQLLQQSLANATVATPVPTAAPVRWCAPLETMDLLRGYDNSSMIYMDSGVWTVHDGIDLKADAGTKILSIGDGEIIGAGNDKLHGAWLTIQHQDSIVSHYTGLALLNDYIPGDAVRRGDPIGYSGSGPIDEASLGPHLHLRVTKDGQAIDPCSLWTSSP